MPPPRGREGRPTRLGSRSVYSATLGERLSRLFARNKKEMRKTMRGWTKNELASPRSHVAFRESLKRSPFACISYLVFNSVPVSVFSAARQVSTNNQTHRLLMNYSNIIRPVKTVNSLTV